MVAISPMAFYDPVTGTVDRAALEAARRASGGMLTTPVVTPSVVPSVAPTAPTGTVQGGGAINPIAVTKENNPEGQYLIIPASTRGEAKNPFIAPPEPYYGTEADLREMYDNTNELKDTFGSFDNYLSYSQEVQSNLENADWFIKEDDSWRPSSVEWAVLNGDDRGLAPNEREQAWSRINDRRKNAVKSNYQQWLMQEDTQGLLSKYGIEPVKYDDKGNVYTFTGNNYQMTVKADQPSFADYATAILKVATSAALSFGLTQAFIAPLAQSAGLTYGQTGQIVNSLINAGGTAAGAAGSLDNAVNVLDVANTANNVINQTDDSFSLFQPVATQQPATSTPSVPGISSAGGFIQGKAQEVIDWVSGQVDGFLSQNPKDAAQTIRDVLEAAGVNLPGGDVKDILEGGFGVRWDNFNPSNLGAGTIFIPGIPTSGFLPSSIDLGTIGDLLSAENPIDQLISMGEEKLNEILEAATDPVGILGAVFQKTDVLPTAVEALITAGGIGQAAIDWYNNRKEEQQSSEGTSPTLPLSGQPKEEEEQQPATQVTPETVTREDVLANEDLFVTPDQITGDAQDIVTPEELAGNQDIFGDTTQEDTASIVDSLLGEYTTPIREDIQRQQQAIDNLVDQVANSPVPPTTEEVANYLQENGVPLDQATLTDIQNRINEATANQVTQEQVAETISGAGLASSAEVDALGESLAADIAANGTLTEANAEAIGELGLTVDEFITQYGADVVGLNEAIAATDQNVIELASTVETGFADVNTKIDDLSTGVQEELETIAGQITANGEVSAENQARLDELGVTLGDISAEFGDQYASLSDIVSSGLEEAEAQRQELAESIAANGELTEANLEAITSLGTNLDDFVAQYATDVEGLNEAVAATDESVLSLAETTEAGFEAAQEEREALASALDAVGGDVTALDAATQQRFEDLGVTVSDLATEFGDQFANLESSVAEDITGLETAFGEGLAGLETAFGEDIGALEETVTTGFGQAADARAALAESLSGKLAEQAEGFNTALTTSEANLLSEITGVESSVLEELSTQTGALEELITNQGTTFEKAQEDINNYLADFALQTEQGFGQAAEERGALQEGLLGLGTALGLGLTGLETQFGQGLTELGSELGGQIGGVQEELLSGLSEAELGRRQLASRINQREFKPAPIPQLSYQPLQLEGLIQGPQRDYVNELNQIINRSLFEGMI